MESISPISESGNNLEVTDAVTGKIIYCNGMTTSEDLALTHARSIALLTGLEVELHYNNTTSLERALKITAKLGLGSLGICYALVGEKKCLSTKWITRGIGIAGFVILGSGIRDLAEIEQQKNASAQRLACRIISYLNAHPLHHVTLIFHSQGADIGHRALEKLASYKDRIKVVTIGGMVDIPDHFALSVVNFLNENDLIAYLAKTLYRGSGKITQIQIKDPKGDVLDCHYSTDYLGKPQVRKTILDFVHPSQIL